MADIMHSQRTSDNISALLQGQAGTAPPLETQKCQGNSPIHIYICPAIFLSHMCVLSTLHLFLCSSICPSMHAFLLQFSKNVFCPTVVSLLFCLGSGSWLALALLALKYCECIWQTQRLRAMSAYSLKRKEMHRTTSITTRLLFFNCTISITDIQPHKNTCTYLFRCAEVLLQPW